MIQIELSRLVERLNPICRQMLEAAAAYCVTRHEDEIRIEHLLHCMLEAPSSQGGHHDVFRILDRGGIKPEAVRALLRSASCDVVLASGYPTFSPLLVEWLQHGWLLASTELRHTELRSGVLLLVLLMMPARYLPTPLARLLAGIDRDALRSGFDSWVLDSTETVPLSMEALDRSMGIQPDGGNAALVQELVSVRGFLHDMTSAAREGAFDPVLCREHEIGQMIDILCRRRKNNPLVVGEAGVGKSALIEGLALRIVAGQVPEKLRDVTLFALDLVAMQAGAVVRGEFEKRFKAVLTAITASMKPVILFIDEAHTLIGSGNPAGGLDMANLLKPALARGALRTIAATTWGEYKKYIEKDAALARRFQLVKVREPDVEAATVILRGLRHTYEQAHGVLIDDAALAAAARLSARYLAGRQLPDKAIDVLDTACARVAINLTTPPRDISDLQTRLQQQVLELEQLEREQQIGLSDSTPRQVALRQAIDEGRSTLAAQLAAWQQQQLLVRQIITCRKALLEQRPLIEEATGLEKNDVLPANRDGNECNDARLARLTAQLQALETNLDRCQQMGSLVCAHVDQAQVAAVIAEWTGVPVQRMSQGELEIVTRLPEYLGTVIRGQSAAIEHLHRHLLTARADLRRSGRPLGAMLLVGPSGVGKTESVLHIAELLFGGRQYLTTLNMSEYQEKHTLSRLIGSPPGYVGFGEGGVLSEAIRQKPYSVVLLDEVEKAHPDVLNLFYQAFDKGELADGEGRLVDCRNVVFFLTSNLGDQTIVEYADRPEALPQVLYPQLTAFFKPALLARMEVVPFLPLAPGILADIVRDKLDGLACRLQQRFGAAVEIDEAVGEEILRRTACSDQGARGLESIIDGALLPPVSLQLLQHMARGAVVRQVGMWVANGHFVSQVEG